jgi:hypothetical protein
MWVRLGMKEKWSWNGRFDYCIRAYPKILQPFPAVGISNWSTDGIAEIQAAEASLLRSTECIQRSSDGWVKSRRTGGFAWGCKRWWCMDKPDRLGVRVFEQGKSHDTPINNGILCYHWLPLILGPQISYCWLVLSHCTPYYIISSINYHDLTVLTGMTLRIGVTIPKSPDISSQWMKKIIYP